MHMLQLNQIRDNRKSMNVKFYRKAKDLHSYNIRAILNDLEAMKLVTSKTTGIATNTDIFFTSNVTNIKPPLPDIEAIDYMIQNRYHACTWTKFRMYLKDAEIDAKLH